MSHFATLFTILTLICFSFYVKNQVVFQTNITEVGTLEKGYWYCKCKLLIASLYSLFKASSPKRHCSSRLTVKFYTLFNNQDLVFSCPYLTCMQWFFFSSSLDNCSCKVEKMTHMATDSPVWPSRLKLGMNLIVSTSTSTLCHFFPYSSHTGASVSWI